MTDLLNYILPPVVSDLLANRFVVTSFVALLLLFILAVVAAQSRQCAGGMKSWRR